MVRNFNKTSFSKEFSAKLTAQINKLLYSNGLEDKQNLVQDFVDSLLDVKVEFVDNFRSTETQTEEVHFFEKDQFKSLESLTALVR